MAAAMGASVACADAGPRWYLQVDNDVVFGTDRWYTSGVRISRVTTSGPVETELSLLQEVYTPDPIDLHPVDRAPAARLLGAWARHERGPTTFLTWEVALGVRGPSALGEQSTREVHRLIPARYVDWTRQEPDQFDGQLTIARTDAWGSWRTHVGAVAGTEVVFAHAGGAFTFGAALDSPVLRFAPTPPWDGTAAQGWGGFVGASARLVARNEMLHQPYLPWMPEIERENAVGRLAAGLSWRAGWGSVVLAVAQDSKEFKQQAESHRFGSLLVHIPF